MTPREMDAYIAERCFVVKYSEGFGGDAVYTKDGGLIDQIQFFMPTISMIRAWPVFEWLLENHPWTKDFGVIETYVLRADIVLCLSDMGKPSVKVIPDWQDLWDVITFDADTFPMAICKTFIAACEEIERVKGV